MSSIVSYRKAYDTYTTYQLALPDGVECVELCEIAGITYVFLPTGAILPPQPAQIADSVAVVVPDAALRSVIKAASPHCALIKSRGHQRVIYAGYSVEDQTKLDRQLAAVGAGLITLTTGQRTALEQYAAANFAADAWAGEQYAELGL